MSQSLAAKTLPKKPPSPHLATPAPRTTPSSPNLRPQFDQAVKIYNSGKLQDALLAFDRIIRQFPGHEPSIVYLAKILYRFEKYRDAYQAFIRVNPGFFDSETAYEFGFSAFEQKDYVRCLDGMKRVAEESAKYDLANYYGGIAALHLKDLDQSESMFKRAVVLPEKLARAKPTYLKQIEQLRTIRQKNEFSTQQLEEKQRKALLPTPSAKLTMYSRKSPFYKADFTDYEGVTDLEHLERYAKILYSYDQKEMDFHGNVVRTARTSGGEFRFQDGPTWRLPIKFPDGSQPVIGANIQAFAESKTVDGKEQRLVATENTSDIVRVQSTEIESKDVKGGRIGGNIWGDLPVAKHWWLGAATDVSYYFPDFERAGRYGSVKGSMLLGYHERPQLVRAKGFYEQLIGTNNKPGIQIFGMEFNYSYLFPINFEIEPSLVFKNYKYDEPLEGPDSDLTASLKLTQWFPYGISAYGIGYLGQQSRYVTYQLVDNAETGLSADGSTLGGQIGLKLEPVKWVFAEAQYSVAQTTWNVENQATESLFQKSVADYQSAFKALVGVNLLFY